MKGMKDLFFKYLRNECNAAELETVLEWMKDEANTSLVEKYMKEDWDNYVKDISNPSFEKIKSQIKSQKTRHSGYSKTIYKIGRIAAGFILPVSLGILTYFVLKTSDKNETIVYNEISVPLGSKTKVQLADGTKIWLNAGSKLKYPQKFTGNFREVELTGEGYFDVVKNPQKPFIVKTSDINIKVLGTSFNVKSYPDEGTIETTLISGQVNILKKTDNAQLNGFMSLKPKQRATFIKNKGKIILSDIDKKEVKNDQKNIAVHKKEEHVILTKNIDTEQFVAWKDNKLVFKNEDFESLCIKLERWYNVKINLKNNDLKKFHYTGIIENETINDVINILQLTMPIRYESKHSVIDIWSVQYNEKKATQNICTQ
jgi:ferric-dicitrate binding protein FerR (iron transport regulator)